MIERETIRVAHENDRAQWRFVFYAPGERMTPHRHDLAHFSLVLTGIQREVSRRKHVETGGMWMAFKPRNFSHENEFGPDGALLLSISLGRAGENDEEIASDAWRTRSAHAVHREWRALVGALNATTIDGAEVDDLTDDILSSLLIDDERRLRREPPAWLRRARDAVLEGRLRASEIAQDAKVHRVHLSRAYKAHFGVTLSEDRRRARLDRAAREIVFDRAAIAQASISSGFADQAHLTRGMRAATGLTPKMLSRLF